MMLLLPALHTIREGTPPWAEMPTAEALRRYTSRLYLRFFAIWRRMEEARCLASLGRTKGIFFEAGETLHPPVDHAFANGEFLSRQ